MLPMLFVPIASFKISMEYLKVFVGISVVHKGK